MRTLVIAEVGANHGGDIELAKEMIWSAAEAGANFVKFQSWRVSTLDKANSAYERHAKAELSDDDHFVLKEECDQSGVAFLTTCFDRGRAEFLATLGLDAIKVASPDVGSVGMLTELAERFPHLIVSTGMAPDEEIEAAAKALAGHDFTFLHCVSLYPTPIHKVNMERMHWLSQFTDSVGFSDHTMGTAAPKLAIAQGAAIVEKHFTIDRNLPGKDQAVSALPFEIREIVAYAEAVETMMGVAHPGPSEQEDEMRETYIGKWGDNR